MTMTCCFCGSQMVMDEWDGWQWICINCDNSCQATDDEIKEYEQEML